METGLVIYEYIRLYKGIIERSLMQHGTMCIHNSFEQTSLSLFPREF